MAKEQKSTQVRGIFYGVRWNITIAIIVLVASSVFTLAFVLVRFNNSTTVSRAQLNGVITGLSPETHELVTEDIPDSALDELSRELVEEYGRDRVSRIYQITPLIIGAAGILAYAVARQILKPIRDSYDAQERFLQDAAHEFRNPLAALKVTVQNIKQKGTIGKKEAVELLKSTETQVNRLISINEDLLYLEKQEIDKKQAKQVNISELLTDVLEDLQSLANQADLELISTIQENVMLKIPTERFVKISRNIIGNAIKYSTKDSDQVRVSLSSKNNKVRFSVRDFGVGIPSHELAHIGRRFFRASNTSKFEGSGLGMAIVQKSVTAQGGTITVNSTVNEGTHVIIDL